MQLHDSCSKTMQGAGCCVTHACRGLGSAGKAHKPLAVQDQMVLLLLLLGSGVFKHLNTTQMHRGAAAVTLRRWPASTRTLICSSTHFLTECPPPSACTSRASCLTACSKCSTPAPAPCEGGSAWVTVFCVWGRGQEMHGWGSKPAMSKGTMRG